MTELGGSGRSAAMGSAGPLMPLGGPHPTSPLPADPPGPQGGSQAVTAICWWSEIAQPVVPCQAGVRMSEAATVLEHRAASDPPLATTEKGDGVKPTQEFVTS